MVSSLFVAIAACLPSLSLSLFRAAFPRIGESQGWADAGKSDCCSTLVSLGLWALQDALESCALQVERLEPMDEESMQTCSDGTCGQGVGLEGGKPVGPPGS